MMILPHKGPKFKILQHNSILFSREKDISEQPNQGLS